MVHDSFRLFINLGYVDYLNLMHFVLIILHAYCVDFEYYPISFELPKTWWSLNSLALSLSRRYWPQFRIAEKCNEIFNFLRQSIGKLLWNSDVLYKLFQLPKICKNILMLNERCIFNITQYIKIDVKMYASVNHFSLIISSKNIKCPRTKLC